MSVSSRQLFTETQQQLQQIYPVEEARTIAFLLLEHCYGLSRTAVLADKLISAESSQLPQFIERLLRHEPVQYVLGKTLFYGRWFEVNPSVLIPRPETEELVDWIIQEYAPQKTESATLVDIGTGSGCIAITLAAELPGAQVIAIDVSAEALKVAQTNGQLNQVAVQFIQSDILEAGYQHLPAGLPVDLIVSNPPYVTRAETGLMRKNVMEYEPHLALFVEGMDALLFYRHIAGFGRLALKKGGACYVETNENYTRHVQQLFEEEGYSSAQLKTDMFGKERFVKAIL